MTETLKTKSGKTVAVVFLIIGGLIAWFIQTYRCKKEDKDTLVSLDTFVKNNPNATAQQLVDTYKAASNL